MRHRIFIPIIVFLSLWVAVLFSQNWQIIDTMSLPRFGMALAADESHIYLIGGLKQDLYTNPMQDTVARRVDVFDHLHFSWSRLPSLNQPRYNASALIYQGELYVFNGRDLYDSLLTTVERFNFQTQQWEVVLTGFNGARSETGTVLFGDTLFQVGGSVVVPPYHLIGMVLIPAFQAIPSYSGGPQPQRVLPAVAALGDHIYVVGGIDVSPTTQVLKIDHRTLAMEQAPELNTARARNGAVALRDTLWTIGGVNSVNQSLASVEYLTQGDTAWHLGTGLAIAREGLSAVQVNDNLFVFGGWNSNTNQPVAEVEGFIHNMPVGFGSLSGRLQPQTVSISAYPNPFNSAQTIRYFMPASGNVRLELFNVAGQRVGEIYSGRAVPGWTYLHWEMKNAVPGDLPGGVYFLLLRYVLPHRAAGNAVLKIVYLK